MRAFFILLFCLLNSNSCLSQNTPVSQAGSKVISTPFYFNINDDLQYSTSKAASVIVTGPNDSLVYDAKNLKPFKWGWEKPGTQLMLLGTYAIHVKFYEDTASPATEFTEHFNIEGDEIKVELNVNVERIKEVDNCVYLTKYFGNKYNMQLKRLWNPVQQFKTKKEMMPQYEFTNNCDSDISGVERRTASWSTIMGVLKSSLVGLQIQVSANNDWYPHPGSDHFAETAAPLKKGQSVSMTPDTSFHWQFERKMRRYTFRALVEYTINDDITRKDKLPSGSDEANYKEVHVYEATDEFTFSR